jgi:glycosyltransferase involved in cell wall biosynthesis
MTDSRILVLLPTLGERPDYLRETIKSIVDQKVDCDIVMIYPLKNEEVGKIADSVGAIKVEDPGGLSKALNVGLSMANEHHKFVSWIGDDDLLTESSLQVAKKHLEEQEDAVVVYGYCDYIDEEGRFLFKNKMGSLAPWLMTWGPNLVPCPGALFRRSALVQVGLFDENLRYTMDLDIFLKLRKVGKFINAKCTLSSFRWHSLSMTVSGRENSLSESQNVKRKHMPAMFAKIAFLWEGPIRIATRFAARRVDSRVQKIQLLEKENTLQS